MRERPGCTFVAFSSVTSTFGGTLAGAYSASNRFLELLTHELLRRGQSQAWCIGWSTWDELGMSRDFPLKDLAAQPRIPADQRRPRDQLAPGCAQPVSAIASGRN